MREAHMTTMPRSRSLGLGSLVPMLVLAAAAWHAQLRPP